MKRFILLFTIVLHAAFSSDFVAYAQTKQQEDIIKKDSALFHELAIDDTICPMINFQLAMQCYNFLKTRVRDKDCVKNRVKRAKIVRFTLC